MGKKAITNTVFSDRLWTVHFGTLNRSKGRPESVQSLFSVLGEKLPFEALKNVRTELKRRSLLRTGVYVAHDSMGYARYVGRGNIFARLLARQSAQHLELKFFSFYVVRDKKHQREIETLLIRAAGPMLQFNTRKKRLDLSAGSISDYEAGTLFFERHYKKGKQRKAEQPA